MGAVRRSITAFALVAGMAAPWGGAAQAQGFAADYGLLAPSASAVDLNRMRLAPSFQSGPDASGAGLSLFAGANWYGQMGMTHQRTPLGLAPNPSADMLNLGGGYRWSDGQSLSFLLSRGRGSSQRLGLAVSYDWPQYFVRFSWDQGASTVPQDNLRFSAGVRF